jgi:hypothetical protein
MTTNVFVLVFFLYCASLANGLVGRSVVVTYSRCPKSHSWALQSQTESQDRLREEAEVLLSRARKLRSEIGEENDKPSEVSEVVPKTSSPWSVVSSSDDGAEYRLYVDIGREEGTWMDRRWGASERRVPFTVDIKFSTSPADASVASKMVKDNFGGKSSRQFLIETGKAARLRDGFDSMKCQDGCYRIDSSKGGDTVRFYISVDGTTGDQDYG